MNRGTEEVSMASKELVEAHSNTDASSSKQKPEGMGMKFESGNVRSQLDLSSQLF